MLSRLAVKERRDIAAPSGPVKRLSDKVETCRQLRLRHGKWPRKGHNASARLCPTETIHHPLRGRIVETSHAHEDDARHAPIALNGQGIAMVQVRALLLCCAEPVNGRDG